MKMRTLLLGLFSAGLVQSAANAVSVPDTLELMMHTGPESPDLAVIKVDGDPNGRYDKILTDTLEYDVYVRGDRPDDGILPHLGVHLEDEESRGVEWSADWKKHTLTMPYGHPGGADPVELCNDRLRKTSGVEREEFLKKGTTFNHGGAYTVHATIGWMIDRFPNSYFSKWEEEMTVPVKIKCLGLNRNLKEPKPSRTTPPPTPSRTTPPLFAKTTFEIEPSKIVKDGKHLCPSELRLYGYVEANGAFEGKSIFMGPHYLSAMTELDISRDGSRNVIGTYPIKWHQVGGLAAQANTKPADQKLAFRFNISDRDGKLVESMEKTVTVSCKKIKPNDAAVGGEMAVTPAN
ncbi:MAG: hypothetical protein HC861_00240 [Rhodospirillaceae bacterium]|nr:hypothetical protein [Rhodospirillaceae bacterium]